MPKKPPHCLPMCLYHFTFPPTMGKNFYCFISSPAFCVVSVLHGSHCNEWYLTVVSICISLMTHDVVHLFICLFATCISLLRCRLRSLAQLFETFLLIYSICIGDFLVTFSYAMYFHRFGSFSSLLSFSPSSYLKQFPWSMYFLCMNLEHWNLSKYFYFLIKQTHFCLLP